MKIILSLLLVLVLVLVLFLIRGNQAEDIEQYQPDTAGHLYASWDTMEFDKCVAVWLITRFIDPNAQFVFYPQETVITEGIAFDIPSARWSRKHRKCTSQCIWETIAIEDSAAERIIDIAGKIELNFWQLDRWPEVQKCFYEVKEIMDKNPEHLACFEKTNSYFDRLYQSFLDNDSTSLKKEQ